MNVKKKSALETGLFVEQLKRFLVNFCFTCSLKLFAFSTGGVGIIYHPEHLYILVNE